MNRAFLLSLLVALALPAAASAQGPALSVPEAQLAAALKCSSTEGRVARAPVLMVPGTGLDPDTNFSWNWLRALDALKWPWCTVRSPDNAMADIQRNGEHIVYAIRTMHARFGRKVQVVGFSQGGMAPRWALRWWPDTRDKVEDLVGLAPSNHGTITADAACAGPDGCAPAVWQQRTQSAFMRALNTPVDTYAPIAYTSIYTRADQVVVPNLDAATGSSSLRTGDGARTNVALQDLCPTQAADHLYTGSADAVAYAIAMDALTHDGPADPARVDRLVCLQATHPGVNRATFAQDFARYTQVTLQNFGSYPRVRSEPPLACYAGGPCGTAPSGGAGRPSSTAGGGSRPATAPRSSGASRACASRRAFSIRLRGRPVSARVTVNGKRVRVGRSRGRLVARIDLRGVRSTTAVVRVSGRTARGRAVRETRRYRLCTRR